MLYGDIDSRLTTNTITVIDDFNDNLNGWTEGTTGSYSIDTGTTKEGAGSATVTNSNDGDAIQSNTDDGLGNYPQAGDDPFYWWIRFDTVASTNCQHYFQVASDGNFANSDGYQFTVDVDADEISIEDSVNSTTVGAATSITGGLSGASWYLCKGLWDDGTKGGSNGDLTFTFFDSDGTTQLAQASGNSTALSGPAPIKINMGEFAGTSTQFWIDYLRHESNGP